MHVQCIWWISRLIHKHLESILVITSSLHRPIERKALICGGKVTLQKTMETDEDLFTTMSASRKVKPLQIVFLGASAVGKTSIIHQFLYGVFTERTSPTLGKSFFETIQLPSKPITLSLFDTCISMFSKVVIFCLQESLELLLAKTCLFSPNT